MGPLGGPWPDGRRGRELAARPTGGPTWCRVASALGALRLTSVTCTTASGCCGEAAGRKGCEQGLGTALCSWQRGGPPLGPTLEMRLGTSVAPRPLLLLGPGVAERRAVTSDPRLQATCDPPMRGVRAPSRNDGFCGRPGLLPSDGPPGAPRPLRPPASSHCPSFHTGR